LAYCTSPGWWWWCEAVDGMIGRGNRCTRRNPGPVPHRPPQIPHDLTLARTRRLTACKPLQCLCDRIPTVREAIASRPARGPTQPVFERVPGALSVRVKRPGCEADGSPPSSAEAKSGRGIPPSLLRARPNYLSTGTALYYFYFLCVSKVLWGM
jgi:hypothetical protein